MTRPSLIVALLCLVLAALPARAAPLLYDEAVDGDLDGEPTLNFGFGVNQIIGSRRGTVQPISGDFSLFDTDEDYFGIAVPSGGALRSGRVDARFVDTTMNTAFYVGVLSLLTTDVFEVAGGCVWFVQPYPGCDDASAGVTYFDGLLLTDPLYRMSGIGAFWLWSDPSRSSGGDIHYTLSFEVVAVPEPGSLLLVIAGLGLLVHRRSQQRRPVAHEAAI